LLVDLDGDSLDVLGMPCGSRPGIADWLASSAEPDALADLVVAAGDRCDVLPAGTRVDVRAAPADRLQLLVEWLAGHDGQVVVDAGTGDAANVLVERAPEVLLVTRACYLALRRARESLISPTGVILVREPGRALTTADVAATLGTQVVAEIQFDPAISRAVDAGLLVAALPRGLQRAIRRLAA
jgi:hypothetical protein